jgi:transcriptional regulator with XRE-family HTH domain
MGRWERGWSLAEFERETGIPEKTLWRYERGKTAPDAERLAIIARVLGTTPNDLLGFSTESTSLDQPTREHAAAA